MKIKVRPEDFIVEEEANINFRRNGRFKVYSLKKRNFNTIDVLIKLSRKLKIPFRKFAYGGRKDRYGLTTQYITIEGVRIEDIKEKSFELNYIGETDRPMGPSLIIGNRFKIIVRDLENKDLEYALEELDFVKSFGFPNYFDDQRFGNYSKTQGFFAEKLVKREFNGALKIYLTAIHPEDKGEEKIRKRFFFEHWRDWERCLEKAKTNFERKVFAMLSREKDSFLQALSLIPEDELSMFISSFQAYLWNNLVERLVRYYADGKLLKYKGNYWDYVFYKSKEIFNRLENLSLPLASQRTKMPDELAEKIYGEILKERNLKPACFNLRKFRKVYFKSTVRNVVVVPKINNFSIFDDEFYKDKKALCICFWLPRGSYGTMLFKRLFAK